MLQGGEHGADYSGPGRDESGRWKAKPDKVYLLVSAAPHPKELPHHGP